MSHDGCLNDSYLATITNLKINSTISRHLLYCVAQPREVTLDFFHKTKGSSIKNCLTKRITGLFLFESTTLLANFRTNSVVSIYVLLANIALGKWPDRNMKNIRKSD